MDITPINNTTQYEDYCAEAGRLVALDPDPDSSEGKKLALLSFIIEAYEKEHFTFEKPTPVEAILFRMEQQGLTQVDLVPYIGSRSRVSEILSEKRSLTLPMIRNLSEGLGIPANILIQDTNESSNETSKQSDMEDCDLDMRSFPIAEMVKRSWLPKDGFTVKNYPVHKVEEFFSPIGGASAIGAFWRRSSYQKPSNKKLAYSLLAWAGKVLREAEKVQLPVEYKQGSITSEFKTTLAHLSLLDHGPLAAKELLLKSGIVLIIEPHLEKTKLDGAALLLRGKVPVIGLTLRHDRLDNFWFTLMHELIHVERHLFNSHTAFFDDLENIGTSEIEREANRESGEVFVSAAKLKRSSAFKLRTESEVRKLAEELRIHPSIVAGRISFELKDYQLFNRLVRASKVRGIFNLD